MRLTVLLFAAVLACEPRPPSAQAPPAPSAAIALPAPSQPAAAPTTPDAPFRSGPPAPAGAIAWTPPRIGSWSLSNGTRVLLVERHELPIVAVRIVSNVGAGDIPAARPGAVAFMGGMLEQGAGKSSALELSDSYEALGAEHSAWCDWDACVVRAKVLSSRLGPVLDLIADVALRPAFSPAEIERVRKRWLASLQQEKSSPPAMEQNALAAALYGRTHPYGHSIRGEPGDITALKREEIARLWQRAFGPRSMTIVVAGDVDAASLRSLLEARFGGAHAGAAEAPARSKEGPSGPTANTQAAHGAKSGLRVVLVDVPGAAQSQVLVAHPGAPFGTPDRIPLGVMNAILGGMFSSRINLDLREAHAYTYGAHSRFGMRHAAGPFAAGGAIFTEHTLDAVRELLSQVARIREEPVTEQELADAKENAKLALPARFESVDDVAGALQDLAVYDLPLDEYAQRAARIDAVSAADVQRGAKAWLHPESLVIVVAGDRAKIEGGLASLGTVELRDAYGEPLK